MQVKGAIAFQSPSLWPLG